MTPLGADTVSSSPKNGAAIDCHHLQYAYQNTTSLFSNLNITIPQKGLFGLFGPSGIGKTTLARLITGLLQPDAGRIDAVDGRMYTHSNERLPGWAPLDRYLRRLAPHPVANRGITEWIHRFGLDGCGHRTFGHLSKGQQNRANLLRYLLLDFNVLVMDESLANVDAIARHRILADITSVYPERTFIYISHHISDVTRFCRRILVLRPGDSGVTPMWIDGIDASEDPNASNRVLTEILHGI